MDEALAARLRPCGPVVDTAAAERALESLAPAADLAGWRPALDQSWPALAPIFAASPYLASLARRAPDALQRILTQPPDHRLAALLAAVVPDEVVLRRLKAETHLLTALADLGGVWDLEAVTGALTDFADAAVRAAFTLAAREARAAGRLQGRWGRADPGSVLHRHG